MSARPSESWPRLTETLTAALPAGNAPEFGACLSCGAHVRNYLWQEHDHLDRPEPRFLWLCVKCSDELIEPHVRLYAQLDSNAPAPGAMGICNACEWRAAGRCTCPTARVNGGAGIRIKASRPCVAFVDGVRNGRRSGWRQLFYAESPTDCTGRKAR